ncbi:acyl-CoA thioesterase [Vaginella massiliensis]|uniref:acyl-CoA thioesterase n=1 Tax=Vaginella massiliensis TaxID=1816680 RepID=UPI00083900EF|nr:acyl-CoA thioesterase [Vaginella massiliensis]
MQDQVLEDKMILHKERIENSKTVIFRAVFPGDTNHHNTMFGGNVLSLMDEVSFLTATRFAKKPIVTVSSNKINFTHPIPSGTIIKLQGEVVKIGNTSVDVKVDLWVESMYQEGVQHAISGTFTLVAINENKKPVPII